MALILKKPSKSSKQPAVGRLLSRDEKGRFIKSDSKRGQKRDKFGRFVKVNRLGIAKRNPDRVRDKYGRFVAHATSRKVYRDKYGRFSRAPLVWYRRRYIQALPFILGLCGLVFFGYLLNKPIVIDEPVAASPVQAAQPQQPEIDQVTVVFPKSEPTRLRIPKIAVNTGFTELGKEPDGEVEVPSDPYIAGWYNRAPTPGEMGPAVVIGHVDRPGGPAVFWRLRELVPGDTFEIDRKDGSTVKFKVDQVKQLPQSDFPTEEVYGNLDYAGIRLITCGGTFNRATRSYSHNTVVYGSLIVEETKVSQAAN